MVIKKTVTEVARNFSHLINSVSYNHDTIVLVRGRREVAELRPIVSGVAVDEFSAILETPPRLSKEESKSFSEDIVEVRRILNEQADLDPWES